MQELRLVMIVIGAVAIVALLIHGLWASKKERPAKFSERPIQKVVEKDKDGFDQDGIGSVRVVKSRTSQVSSKNMPERELEDDPLFYEDDSAQVSKKATNNKMTKSQNSHYEMKAVKDFYHFEDTEEDIALAEEEKALQQQREQEELENQQEEAAPQQVLMFNVQATANKVFAGEDLFNCLEQYGMQFGEMDIFHRHLSDAGEKVIFSAANMFNPGSFPISTPHQFTTPGITFFMTLPCHGEADQNFKLMLKTAQQVANLLGGHVTDDSRNLLTPKRIDEYRERIRQFTATA